MVGTADAGAVAATDAYAAEEVATDAIGSPTVSVFRTRYANRRAATSAGPP